jgi:hypothetical protein
VILIIFIAICHSLHTSSLAGEISFSETGRIALNDFFQIHFSEFRICLKGNFLKMGQLKPGYNLQLSTNNQFIAHYTVHQKPTDTTTFIPHFKEFEKLYKKLPKSITADAGYGSEENYEFIDQKKIDGYVKYNYFHKEQKQVKKENNNFKDTSSLYYNQDTDTYYCPMGQPMERIGLQNRTTRAGYQQSYALYRAKNCYNCPLRGSCHNEGNREISVNHRLQ